MLEVEQRQNNAVTRPDATEGAVVRADQDQRIALTDGASIEFPSDGRRRPSFRRLFRSGRLLSFIALVIIPTIAASTYYAIIASPQYTVEARFVVRQNNQGQNASSTSKQLAQAASMSPGTTSPGNMSMSGMTSEDAYVVASYIRSRAMVDDLSKVINVREIYRRPEADFFSRLKDDATIEELEDYWRDMVTTYIDGPSGIVTLRVRAFRPADALAIGRAIDQLAEKLVNDISVRARQDALARTQQDVDHAEDAMRSIFVQMEAYRDREGMISPLDSAARTGTLLKQVLGDRIETDSQLFVTERLSPGSPTIAALAARRVAINARIDELQSKLTGDKASAHSIAASLVKFEELSVNERLAEQMYALARNELERARQTAEKRWVYLTAFVPPALPEKSYYPRRLAFSALVALALLVFWSIGALTWASVQDHRL
jgi:capsular polysaccharide transport system permease protein